MDSRQLRYFLTIAKEGQITRAAQKLNMAQPPLSQQLKQLEDELGTLLFERIGKRIELTYAGKRLYKKAEQILRLMDDAKTEIEEIGKGIRGELAIGSIRSFALTLLPPRISDFRKRYPEVSYKILEGDPSLLGKYLENRDIELAIVLFPLELDIEIDKIIFPLESYYLAVPKQWREYQGKTHITMEEMIDTPLMVLIPLLDINKNQRGAGIYNAIVESFTHFERKPNIVCQCQDPSILLSLVAAGAGATILPKTTLALYPSDQISVIEITDFPLKTEAGIIWSKERSLSQLASKFIETFQDIGPSDDL